jgi:hypothetical protein
MGEVEVYFKVLPRHSFKGTEKNRNNSRFPSRDRTGRLVNRSQKTSVYILLIDVILLTNECAKMIICSYCLNICGDRKPNTLISAFVRHWYVGVIRRKFEYDSHISATEVMFHCEASEIAEFTTLH